ncbi:pituitary homeobox 1 isoform X1 [Paroedura picta]|uniref:pituitary homeobox 1 isoform X1 n=1 Tax=Paroedura picta TaxID=143630 RepID=UPI0040570CA4
MMGGGGSPAKSEGESQRSLAGRPAPRRWDESGEAPGQLKTSPGLPRHGFQLPFATLFRGQRAHGEFGQRVVRHRSPRKGAERRAEKRRWERRRPCKEEKAEAAKDSFYQPAAARAGGHFPEEPLPGHEHEGGDRGVDQPHGAPSQGVVQEPSCQVAEAGAQPADGPVQERLRAAVQRPDAALRGRVRRLPVQLLARQEPGAGAALLQGLHLLQLHEPALVGPVHVLGAQHAAFHEHALVHGPLGRAGRAQRWPQQPERLVAQHGHVVARLPLRPARLPLQRLPGHLQLQPGQPAPQVQAALELRLQQPAEPRRHPQRLPVQQLTRRPGDRGGAGAARGLPGAPRRERQRQREPEQQEGGPWAGRQGAAPRPPAAGRAGGRRADPPCGTMDELQFYWFVCFFLLWMMRVFYVCLLELAQDFLLVSVHFIQGNTVTVGRERCGERRGGGWVMEGGGGRGEEARPLLGDREEDRRRRR